MKGLQKKMKDQSGASILLAMLFFLLCSMVGASILMAAVSNAGKIRSNREEQQKYLLLSSALRLVCDELTSAEYYGKYTYSAWTEEVLVGEGEAATTETHSYHKYKQEPGDFVCVLKEVLPGLTEELDHHFALNFSTPTVSGTKHYEYEPSSGSFESPSYELTLSVTSDHVEGLEGPENKVTVKLRMDRDLRIWLSAALKEDHEDTNGYIYTMEALLIAQGGDPKFSDVLGSETGGEKQAEPATWTLEWIAKKEAGNDT